MARDYFDESKKKKTTTQKAATKPKSQSSSVAKPKTTTSKATKAASKSTFLGGGASTQKVQKATTNNKPKTVKTQPTKQERINQKMYGSTTVPERRTKAPTSNTQRKANAEANLNLKQTAAQTSRTRLAETESQRRAAQTQKMTAGVDAAKSRRQTQEIGNEIRRSVKDSLSADNRAFAQRQKSGTLTEEDKRKVEQRDQRRAQIAKNTGAVAKKAIKDTGSGYAQTLYDLTDLTASNKNGTQAKAMKMGIDPNKDKNRMAELERQQKYTAEESKRRRDELFRKQEQRQAEWDERTKNAKGLEKAWYGAVESGTGMLADTAVGAVTGTGQFGALASMGLRTYGPSANQARKEGATDKEARLYGLAQSAKEVGTELMFQGAGLAKAAYGKTGLSLADKSANVLTRGLTGIKADAVGAGVRALGGTAEENIEELAGWMADPLIKELTYGKNVRNRMRENLRANIPQIGSGADAANVASYFSTPKFTDDLTKEYVKSGMSQDKASALAAEMRDYYVAYYSGDQGKVDALEEDLAAKLSGQDKLSFKSWSMDELKDTFASTTLLTLATGIPGAVNTSVKGNQIFDSDEVKKVFGNNAVRKVADAVKNTSNKEMSLKAEVMKQRLDSGKDLTGTQKFDLYQGYIEKVNETSKKARASYGVVENAREEQDLVPTMGMDRAGNTVYAKETQKEYNEKFASTELTVEAIKNYMESDNSISDDESRRANAVKKAVADLHVGGLTVGDVHEFAYGNELAREALKAEEGIDLNRYIVRDANGNVDLAATNEATENALFKINADNAIKAAQAETEVYIDDTRGNIDKDLLTRFGNSGQAAWKEVNKNLDPRDLKNYLTTANAASYFYSAGRNTDMSVDTAIDRYADTFKTVDNSVLEKAFAAGAEDRIIANTPGYGQTVESGSNIKLKNTEPIVTGQLIMDDDVVLPDSDQSAYLALAMSTNTNIHIVGTLSPQDANGNAIINEQTGLPVQLNGMSHGNEIYLNMNASAEQNLGYVFMHEMTHQIKQYAPNEYLALENLVRDKWFNKDAVGMQAAIKQRMDLYSVKGGQQLTEEEAVEEIIADAMAEAMDDPNFAAEVCEQDINLGEKILESIRGALRSIRQIFANSDYKNDRFHNSLLSYLGILDEAEKMWIDALHTARQNKADGLIADWQDKANKQNAPRLSVTDSDADYMKAVEAGDMETAQRMVDEAAKANGYVESVYHGTGEYFNIFKMGREGIHLGNIDQAKQVSKNRYHDRSKTTRYTFDEVLNNYEKLDHDAKLKLAAAADRAKWHHTSLVFRDSLPDFDTKNFTDDELKKYVKAVSDEYEKNNVYPLGFELPTFDRKVGENLMHLYAKISNPFVIENDLLDWTPSYIAEVLLQRAEGKTNMDGRFEMYGGGFDMDISGSEFNPDDMGRMDLQRLSGGLVKGDQAWRLLEEVLYWNGGYDGIKYLNKYEGDKNSYSYIALKPSDVKSADPVTYDDNGDVIPLSERFNQESPDIRFSLSEPVERVADLIAVHNLNEEDLVGDLSLGGFPMPSIAITKDSMGHDKYGSISLLFHSSTIDPSVTNANQVFGGDAYTPTFPRIHYKANSAVSKKLIDMYYKKSDELGYETMRPMYEYAVTIDDTLDRAGGEKAVIERAKKDKGLKRLFLRMNDKDVEDVTKTTTTSLSDAEVARNDFWINELGKEAIQEARPADLRGRDAMYHFAEWRDERIEDLKKIYEKLCREVYGFDDDAIQTAMADEKAVKKEISSNIVAASNYLKNGRDTVKTEIDYDATWKLVDEAAKANNYDAWVDDLFKGIEEKSGIRNDKDLYTPAGNMRSWESLHEPVTLDNVVKQMKKELDSGGGTFLGNNPVGAAQKKYKSLDEIRADEDRLQYLDDENYGKLREVATAKLSKVSHEIYENSPKRQNSFAMFGAIDVGSDIAEALNKTRNKAKLKNILERDYSYNVSEQNMDDLMDALHDLANLPTGYFEAKPKRAVRFDEVKAAIVPEGFPDHLKAQLSNYGTNIYEYDPEVEGDRTQKINDAASENDLRFSISANLDEPYMDAVNSGNMEEAQRLVDEAANMAGYTERVYHGTGANFTVFDINKSGNNHGGYSMFGKGFYFSDSEAVANAWGKGRKLMHTFIRLENPYIASDDITEGPLFDAFTELRNKWGFPKKDTLDGILAFETLNEQYGYDYTTELLKENGYDGVIYTHPESKTKAKKEGSKAGTKEYIVFDAENIKSADPVTYDIGYKENGNRTKSVIPLSERFDPTNNDIRYSLPTQDSDGNILTDGQMEYFKNSQARDEQGRLVPVYHATDMGGFTIFDPWKSDDHRSLFFSNRRDAANTYVEDKYLTDEDRLGSDENNGGQTGYYQVYLNLENPLIIEGHGQPWNDIVDGGSVFPAYSSITLRNRSWFEDEAESRDKMYELGQSLYNGDNARERVQEFEGDDYVEIEIFNGKKKIKAIIPLTEEAVAEEAAAAFGVDDIELLQGVASEIVGDMGFGNITKIYDTDMRNTIGEYGYDTREWAEFAEDEGYDGVIFRNIVDIDDKTEMFDSDEEAVSDIYVAFSSNQVKDTRNENPTENPDIRYSITPEDEAMEWLASQYELDDVPLDDEQAEEGRVRMAKSKKDFIKSKNALWNERWLTEGKIINVKSVRKNIKDLVTGVMANSNTDRKYKSEVVDKTLIDAKSAYWLMKEGKHSEAAELLWNSAVKMIENVDFVEDITFNQYKDLRDYMRTTSFKLGEEYWSDVDFSAFRKRNFGRIKLVKGETNIDEIYQELQEKWPEWFDEDEQMTAPDQLLRIEEVLDAIQPYKIAYSSEEAEQLAGDIADALYDIVYQGEEYKSIADTFKERYDAKTKALKARHEEALAKVRTRRDELLAAEKEKTARQKERAELWKSRTFEEKSKRQKDKDVRKKAKYFGKISDNIDWLSTRLLNETKDKNIPEGFRRTLAHMLMQFDMQTERSKALEEKYGPAKRTLQMRELKDRLEKIANEDDTGEFRYDGYLFYMMDALAEKVDGKTIDALDTEDLIAIDTMLKSIVHNFRNYNKIRLEEEKVAIANIGDSIIDAMDERIKKYGKRKSYGSSIRGYLDKLVNEGEETPIYFFERLDPTGQGIGAMYKELRRGEDRHIQNMNFLRNRFKAMFSDYFNEKKPGSKLESWRDTSQAQTFNLKNGSITLNPAQIMSLYCLTKRQQAMGHILGSGIVASPISFGAKMQEKFKGKDEQVDSVMIEYSEVQEIIATLTEDQVHLADEMQALLNNEMAAWGNETSLELHGIKLFREKDYFPIKASNEVLDKSADKRDVNEKIKNFGFTKPLTRNANNAIMIDDIFSVVADHCNKMSLYNSMAIPITDFMRVYNYKQRREGEKPRAVQAVIGEAFTRKANDYIMKFISDVNGNTKTRSDAVDDLMNKTLANYKKASIGFNGRVALQQITAIFRARMVIDGKYFIGTKLISPKDQKEMFEHCPIALWKSWGHYDMDMGRDIEDIMMNNDWSKMDTVTMGVYGMLDNMAWGKIWQAVKKEIKAKHPEVQAGSDEFFRLCNVRASEIFDKTQVVDSIFHRSDVMRSKNTLTKMATSFMAEPTLTYNVFRDSIVKARELMKDGNTAEAGKLLLKMMRVLTVNAIAVGAAAAIWDVVRGKGADDDDDDENLMEKGVMALLTKLGGTDPWTKDEKNAKDLWLINFLNNFSDNAPWAQWNNIYFVKDIVSLKDGWGTSNMALEGWETLFKGATQAKKKLTEGSDKSWYDIWMNIAGGLGYLTGYPVKTFMRDTKAILEKFGVEVFAADGSDESTSLMDSIANKMGYRPIDKKGSSEVKVKDSFLAQLGIGKTEEEKEQDAFEKKTKEIADKYADLSGEERDKKVWSSVTTYLKEQNEDKGVADMVTNGDYITINKYRQMYLAAGGNAEYFDNRILAESKKALKKSIKYNQTSQEIDAQDRIKSYMMNHGVTEQEISEIAYKSDTAKDMKIAFIINDKDAMLETLEPLVYAGLTYEDLERLWTNRNRIDVMKYKSSKGRYADRLKSTGKYIWPTDGVITSHFGYRNAPTAGASSNHPAIDIGAPQGTAVVAADGGVIIYAGTNSGYGNSVGIKHDNGMVTYYNHLYAYNVKVGDTVAQGQQIAQVGSTGISTGPHLDFKILDTNGKPVDPEKYLGK